jgi:hypothetical protein
MTIGFRSYLLMACLFGCLSCRPAFDRSALCEYAPASERIQPDAKADGKVFVVYRRSGYRKGLDGLCEMSTDEYFPDDASAASTDQIDDLLIIVLQKGKFLRSMTAQATVSRSSPIDLYSGVTTISLIDFKSSTLLRRESWEKTDIPDRVPESRTELKRSGTDQSMEYVIEPTGEEIKNHLRALSDRVR